MSLDTIKYQIPLWDTKFKWKLPQELPDLSKAKFIGLDTETCDPDLKKSGPGVRKNGYIVGISVAIQEDGNYKSWYFPFDHAEGKQFDKEVILRWARKELCRPNQPKVGAYNLYDLDYLYHNKVPVAGPFFDIQIAEPLLDENKRRYSLDALAQDYLKESKNEVLLKEVCQNRGWKNDIHANIWKLPPEFIGPYAEDDAVLPLKIFAKQCVKLEQENLRELFQIETKLIPILLAMRQHGVKIDKEKLFKVHKIIKKELITAENKLNKTAGKTIDYWAAESIGKLFDKLKLPYNRTPKSDQPSFTKLWLEQHNHPIAKMIVECRKLNKFVGTFLEGSLINMLVEDRIHCQFNQLKGDEGGTVTGRFSSSNPNLQFIPNRDPKLGPLCRSLFIPEEGEDWGRADYSQIELRILAHYAMGVGAEKIRDQYRKDPKTDYHNWCAGEVQIPRGQAKTINFGIIYGMGTLALSIELGISFKEAETFIKIYHGKLPFLKETINTASRVAAIRGYVRTILNRRRRFNLWEPADYNTRIVASPDKEKMKKLAGRIKRAGTYKAFNAVDQGTAADIMKKAMIDVSEAGICDILNPFLLTVHDEVDVSVPRTKIGKETFKEMCHIMENTIQLKVPLLIDGELKKNWGEKK